MDQKKLKKKSKKELMEKEVPIFITELTYVPPEAPRPPKSGPHYLEPIFFGPVNNVHPSLHSLDFRGPPHIPKSYIPKQEINDLFYPTTICEKKIESPKIKLLRPAKCKPFSDPYSHTCPGRKKVFVPEVKSHVIDLGTTTSVIEAEMSLEVPLYRVKRDCSGDIDTGFELVKYSDLKEEQRSSLPYKERMAHIHFPKQFASVSLIGPPIPASLTITKIPSKRCTTNLLSKAQAKKGSKSEDGVDTTAEKPEESGDNNDQTENVITTEEAGSTSQYKLEENKEEIEEEKEELREENEEVQEEMVHMSEEDTMEETEVENTEDEKTGENTEENEGQEEEYAEEEPEE